MPSGRKATRAMLSLLKESDPKVIYELGSGWGGLAVQIAKTFPHAKVVAFELSPIPYLWSKIQSFKMKNLKFYRKDFLKVDLSTADTMVCYLFPKGMELLEKKLQKQIVISNSFALPNRKPTKTLYVNDFSATPIYRYGPDTCEAL